MEKIWIVDDDAGYRGLINCYLEIYLYENNISKLYEITEIDTTNQGIDYLLQNNQPAVVITDIFMPHGCINGIEFGKKILEKFPMTKIIYMSSEKREWIKNLDLNNDFIYKGDQDNQERIYQLLNKYLFH